MNTHSKLLAASLVLVLGIAALPSVNAAASAQYGSQVLKDSREFTPTMTLVNGGTDLVGAQCYRYDADTADNHFDDVVVLETDGAGDSAPARNDLVIATSGYDGTTLGGVLKAANIHIVGVTPDQSCTVGSVWFIDVNENAFYDDGDSIIACSGAAIAATGAADVGDWCIYLSKLGSKAAGSFVKTGDAVLVGQASLQNDLSAATPAPQLVFFNSQASTGDFAPLDHPGDLFWVDVIGNAADGSVLPLYSVQLFGGTFGHQVLASDPAFTLTVTKDTIGGGTPSTLSICRFNAGTATNYFDDVFVLDSSDKGCAAGNAHQNDLVIATGGFDTTKVGQIVSDSMTALEGETDMGQTADTSDIYVYDTNENSKYDSGDGMLIGNDCTVGTGATTFCIYLTKVGSHAAGSLVRTNDDVLVGSKGLVDTGQTILGTGNVLWFNAIQTTTTAFDAFEHPQDRLWLDPDGVAGDGDSVPLFAIELFGGTFGHQVQSSDNDFTLNTNSGGSIAMTAMEWYRCDAATADNPFDDVFVLGTSGGTTAIAQDDLVIATGGYDGTHVGDLVKASNLLLIGCTQTKGLGPHLFTVDSNENSFYDEGDAVLACKTGTFVATSASDWCVYLTKLGSKTAGMLVRNGDDVVTGNTQTPTDTTKGHFMFFDSQNGNSFLAVEDAGDYAWFAPFATSTPVYVPLYSVRAFGDFASVPAGGAGGSGTGGSNSNSNSNSNSTSQSSSHSSSSSSMAPTPTSETLNPGQTTTAAPKGGSTPGFELVALVGALAVALVLVRRKL